jgi:hypothetical protein
MTQAQINLLKKLIEAERYYWSRRMAGEAVSPDDRGVEVGWINGVNPRTAQTLIDAGLVDTMAIHNHTYLFLGSVNIGC